MSVCSPRHFLPLLAILAAACGESAADSSPDPVPDTPDAATSGTSLSLDPSATITLTPGEPKDVRVFVEPPDVHDVRFALLGESLDASLDADKRLTDPDGRTSVRLTASSSPTTFRLRASAGGSAIAEVPVSVSDEGFATVRILPSYKGIRSTPSWTASAVARSACTDIPGQPPEDGPIVATAFDNGPVELRGLPVGPRIAVTLRSQHAVGGCTEISDLNPGETRDVSLKVSDIPVKVGATQLALAVEMSPDGSAAWPLMESLSETFLDALFPPHSTEAATLLDAIEAQLTNVPSFAKARLLGGWDALVAAWIDQSGQLFRDRVRTWIVRGLDPIQRGETMVGKLTAASPDGGHGLIALDSFYGFSPQPLGVPEAHVVSLTVEPGDVMIVGGKVSWVPSKLIATAGDVGAEALGQEDAVQTLVRAFACDKLAALLETTHALPPGCGADCIETACANGIAAQWNQARLSSTNAYGTAQLSFTISGTAAVSGDAVIVALDAIWAGTQTGAGQEAPVRGTAVGSLDAPRSR